MVPCLEVWRRNAMTLARTSRSLLLYGVLVVPPLGGLLAILHAGRGLTAPRAIGGTWTATFDGPDRCGATGAPIEITVSQSGARAELAFSTSAYPAVSIEVSGDRITGTGRARSADPCGPLAIDARIASRTRLEGTVRHPACNDCPVVRFQAELKPARARPGGAR